MFSVCESLKKDFELSVQCDHLSRRLGMEMHSALGCAGLSACVLGSSVSKAVRRESCKRMCVVFSSGEASLYAGTLYPSSFLSGNLSLCYLLDVTQSVLVRQEQLCLLNSAFFVVSSEMQFLWHGSQCGSVEQAGIVYPPHTPVLIQTYRGGPRVMFCSVQTARGVHLGSVLSLAWSSETSDSQQTWAVVPLTSDYLQQLKLHCWNFLCSQCLGPINSQE